MVGESDPNYNDVGSLMGLVLLTKSDSADRSPFSTVKEAKPLLVRKCRPLRLLLAVQLLNMLGDGLLLVGTTLLIISRHLAAGDLTVFLVCSAAAGLACLVLASFALDSVSRRVVLVAADIFRVCAAALILAYQLGGGGRSLLAFAGIAAGAGVAVYRPAFSAYLGDVSGPEEFSQLNALRSMASKIASVVGPALAGILGTAHAYLAIPILSGLLATASIAAILISPAGRFDIDARTDKRIGLEPVRYVLKHRWMAAIIAQGAVQIGFVAAPMSLLVPLWLGNKDVAGQYGFLMAIEAIGAVIAGLVMLRISSMPTRIAMPMLLLQGCVLVVIVGDYPIAAQYASYLFMGIGMGIFGILWIGSIQAHVPPHLLGRVLSIDALGNNLFSVLGISAAGYLLGRYSVSTIALASLAILVGSVAVAVMVPGALALGGKASQPGIEGA